MKLLFKNLVYYFLKVNLLIFMCYYEKIFYFVITKLHKHRFPN